MSEVRDWTVDYGAGPIPVQIPHAWRQDVPVAWEGPAVYRTQIGADAPAKEGHQRWILFHGVSYEARVLVGGAEVGVHRGIWDAFAFPVPDGDLDIEVHVVKNGGPTFPVRDVASGFLPFVYHTFGGIYKGVEIVVSPTDPTLNVDPLPSHRVRADGTRLLAPTLAVDTGVKARVAEWLASRLGTTYPEAKGTEGGAASVEGPFYVRGVLTWGWYPEIGHCNPPEDMIRKEIQNVAKLGFNLVKFCLWVPSHRYLELLREAGLWAWIELPLWDPTADGGRQQQMAEEMERVVRQYAHHENVALWTCGCELHESTSAAYRQGLYDAVKAALRGHELLPHEALVKDNSGSAEMYGGDLREFGDFYDFHPYCDTPFYPEVLDSLLVGPRMRMPILLGEFNDIDVHRDLARVRREMPYWMSEDANLNDQGVRWQHDLPKALPKNRFANDPDEHRHEALMASSKNKARFIRKCVQEAVRSRSDIAGYVVTGWRDTPISSAGIVDDWHEPRFAPDELAAWNGPSCLFQIPTRRPPWVHGGNRPGWIDPFNWFTGRVFWKIGMHSEVPLEGRLEWDVLHFTWEGSKRPQGRIAYGISEPTRVDALDAREVGQISWDADQPGGYLLRVRFAGVENSWPVWIVPPTDPSMFGGWRLDDPLGHFEGAVGFDSLPDPGLPGDSAVLSTRLELDGAFRNALLFLTGEHTKPMPFWREAAYEFSNAAFWDAVGFREQWERLLPITPDRALDEGALRAGFPGFAWETLLNRIDVRTYAEHPILVRGQSGDRCIFATTLRPFGGLGTCPRGLAKNPSGTEFLMRLMNLVKS